MKNSPEESALLAAYDEDWDELYRILKSFHDTELERLAMAANDLKLACEAQQRGERFYLHEEAQ